MGIPPCSMKPSTVPNGEPIVPPIRQSCWSNFEGPRPYSARNPMALERLQYDGADQRHGLTAGTETVGPLPFLAQLVTHIPNKHQVMTRYDGR